MKKAELNCVIFHLFKTPTFIKMDAVIKQAELKIFKNDIFYPLNENKVIKRSIIKHFKFSWIPGRIYLHVNIKKL